MTSNTIDVSAPGYEAKIITHRGGFLKGEPNPAEEAVVAASRIPVRRKQQALSGLSEVMVIGGISVQYKRIPPIMYAHARSNLANRMERNKPQPQMFVKKGEPPTPADTNPAYLDALKVWESEWENVDVLIASSVSVLAGVKLVDGMPDNDDWLSEVTELYSAIGIEFDLFDEGKTYLFEESQLKELLYKQFFILRDKNEIDRFSAFQETGILGEGIPTDAESGELFRPEQG